MLPLNDALRRNLASLQELSGASQSARSWLRIGGRGSEMIRLRKL
jgi:hypothetical protein